MDPSTSGGSISVNGGSVSMGVTGSTITWTDGPSSTVWFNGGGAITSDRLTVLDSTPWYKTLFASLKSKPLKTMKLWRQFMFSPQKFFKAIKGSLLSIKELKADSMKAVETLIKEANASGQVAYSEHLQKERKRIAKELVLIGSGFLLYISSSDIDKFNKFRNEKIKLDSIRNYCRKIPDKVLAELHRAKQLGVFSDFKILHYDPTGEAVKLTEKEKEAKKDPILFGEIEGSTRLYYIGDWIDEYCDLTLDEFLSVLGADRDKHNVVNITSDLMKKTEAEREKTKTKKKGK